MLKPLSSFDINEFGDERSVFSPKKPVAHFHGVILALGGLLTVEGVNPPQVRNPSEPAVSSCSEI